MDHNSQVDQPLYWKNSVAVWGAFLASTALLILVFHEGLTHMASVWGKQDEYSHAYFIPFITLFFIYQKKSELDKLPFTGSWLGVALLLTGIVLYVLGDLSTIYVIIQYGFLVALFGLILAWVGHPAIKLIWVPLLFLAFMIPLPTFLFQGLSSNLQLVSTDIGVWFIRLLDISVYVEGNVIDLGTYKLQVVEACSGLRYLFPLMALGFMMAYFYKAPFWKRLVIFVSSIPITVFMNSFRIGVIGVMVEYWGPSMAEGFLHDFEGWVVFMACTGILILEMALLTGIGNRGESLQNAFSIDLPDPLPEGANINHRKVPISFVASIVLLITALFVTKMISDRETYAPERLNFDQFPSTIGDWRGRSSRLENIYLDILKLDDYILMDYTSSEGRPVNFYAAYYSSQTKGESAHSPRACLPGGGWKISDIQRATIDVPHDHKKVHINRVIIKNGDHTQLVYYWFHGRGRTITSEYSVKWYLFWDALTKNRSDGALVRLTTSLGTDEQIEHADARLNDFAKQIAGELDKYIPN